MQLIFFLFSVLYDFTRSSVICLMLNNKFRIWDCKLTLAHKKQKQYKWCWIMSVLWGYFKLRWLFFTALKHTINPNLLPTMSQCSLFLYRMGVISSHHTNKLLCASTSCQIRSPPWKLELLMWLLLVLFCFALFCFGRCIRLPLKILSLCLSLPHVGIKNAVTSHFARVLLKFGQGS